MAQINNILGSVFFMEEKSSGIKTCCVCEDLIISDKAYQGVVVIYVGEDVIFNDIEDTVLCEDCYNENTDLFDA